MIASYIINIGDELTKGEICNSNASYIAQNLTTRGMQVNSILIVPDDLDTAARYLKSLLQNEGIFIVTGGLGGTKDDITRKVVASAIGRRLVIDKEKEEVLKTWYRRHKRSFDNLDSMQAAMPEGGRLLENSVGLAYGFYLEETMNKRYIFALPGVPTEMTAMFEYEVLPILEKNAFFSKEYRVRFLIFADIAEYTLDKTLRKVVIQYPEISYGTRSNNGVIRVRLETRGDGLDNVINKIKRLLRGHLISEHNETLEEVVGRLLLQQKLTLATAESCTAGYCAKKITDVAGASQYFLGGLVSYSNEAKIKLLGVSRRTILQHGAVSPQTVEEMARGVKSRFNSDLSISITGIAGPDGGTKQKPVGTVYICLVTPRGESIITHNQFTGSRENVRIRSVNKSLFMLYDYLSKGHS